MVGLGTGTRPKPNLSGTGWDMWDRVWDRGQAPVPKLKASWDRGQTPAPILIISELQDAEWDKHLVAQGTGGHGTGDRPLSRG